MFAWFPETRLAPSSETSSFGFWTKHLLRTASVLQRRLCSRIKIIRFEKLLRDQFEHFLAILYFPLTHDLIEPPSLVCLFSACRELSKQIMWNIKLWGKVYCIFHINSNVNVKCMASHLTSSFPSEAATLACIKDGCDRRESNPYRDSSDHSTHERGHLYKADTINVHLLCSLHCRHSREHLLHLHLRV